MAELEVRVETLEGTAAEHETRLTAAEADIEGLRKEKKSDKVQISLVDKNLLQNFTIALFTSFL